MDDAIRTDVMYAFLVRLQQILDWFQVQDRYHFYSSSLLFIYEGAVSPGDDDALKKPSKLAPHSNGASTPVNGLNGHRADQIFSVKPDTYPLKRKKSSDRDDNEDDGNDDCSCGLNRASKNQRENGVRTEGKGTDSRTSVPLSNSIGSDGEGTVATRIVVTGRHEHEGEIDVNHVKEKQRTSQGAIIRDDLSGSNHNHCHFPTPNHSTHGPDISACTKHRTDQSNARESSRKDSNLPREGATDNSPHHVEIRMIDFAHAIETTTRDENYIFGLKMLHQYIETLHNCHIW